MKNKNQLQFIVRVYAREINHLDNQPIPYSAVYQDIWVNEDLPEELQIKHFQENVSFVIKNLRKTYEKN